MFLSTPTTDTQATTNYTAVIPFYIYASLSFLAATLLLFFSVEIFNIHYFHPKILALTHILALGWGTMIILGASHQLIPVIIEGKLFSLKLAYTTFLFAAIGIPLLVYGFYIFDLAVTAKWGGRFVVLSILTYLINITFSIYYSKKENIHALFIFTATVWLFITVFIGLILVYNFTSILLPNDSLHYLSLHAHAGIIGWFLLFVMGVASRLIPMFLISKYNNKNLLWAIYFLINGALISYCYIFYFLPKSIYTFIPILLIILAVAFFIFYCFQSYKLRLRKQVDGQIKISLLSVLMLLLPIVVLVPLILFQLLFNEENKNLILTYGFLIFFGWLTAIILGMTFKTLPFIVWTKKYQHHATKIKTINPKDLFDHNVFQYMCIAYLSGFLLFATGIYFTSVLALNLGALALIVTSLLYNWNVIRILNYKLV
jgi:hypothetical protein